MSTSKRSQKKTRERLNAFRQVSGREPALSLMEVRILARIVSEDGDLGERWLDRATNYLDDITTAIIEAEEEQHG